MNPDYTKYPVKSTFTSLFGTHEVVGHKEDGTPLVKIG